MPKTNQRYLTEDELRAMLVGLRFMSNTIRLEDLAKLFDELLAVSRHEED